MNALISALGGGLPGGRVSGTNFVDHFTEVTAKMSAAQFTEMISAFKKVAKTNARNTEPSRSPNNATRFEGEKAKSPSSLSPSYSTPQTTPSGTPVTSPTIEESPRSAKLNQEQRYERMMQRMSPANAAKEVSSPIGQFF